MYEAACASASDRDNLSPENLSLTHVEDHKSIGDERGSPSLTVVSRDIHSHVSDEKV